MILGVDTYNLKKKWRGEEDFKYKKIGIFGSQKTQI